MRSERQETTLSSRGGVTVPADIRDQLDLEAGGKLRWHVTDDETLEITVVH